MCCKHVAAKVQATACVSMSRRSTTTDHSENGCLNVRYCCNLGRAEEGGRTEGAGRPAAGVPRGPGRGEGKKGATTPVFESCSLNSDAWRCLYKRCGPILRLRIERSKAAARWRRRTRLCTSKVREGTRLLSTHDFAQHGPKLYHVTI